MGSKSHDARPKRSVSPSASIAPVPSTTLHFTIVPRRGGESGVRGGVIRGGGGLVPKIRERNDMAPAYHFESGGSTTSSIGKLEPSARSEALAGHEGRVRYALLPSSTPLVVSSLRASASKSRPRSRASMSASHTRGFERGAFATPDHHT